MPVDEFADSYVADPRQSFHSRGNARVCARQAAAVPARNQYQYSNTNILLLALVVEQQSGQSLPDDIGEHILSPLKLTHTSFPTTATFPDPHPRATRPWIAAIRYPPIGTHPGCCGGVLLDPGTRGPRAASVRNQSPGTEGCRCLVPGLQQPTPTHLGRIDAADPIREDSLQTNRPQHKEAFTIRGEAQTLDRSLVNCSVHL